MQKYRKYRGEKPQHNKEYKKDSLWPGNALIRTENKDQQEDRERQRVQRNNVTSKSV